MKTKILFLIVSLIISTCSVKILSAGPEQNSKATIYTFRELTPLAKTLVDSFLNSHPDLEMNVATISNDLNECLNNSENLALITQKELQGNSRSDIWNILIAREYVIPVVNSHNPFMDQIVSKGITPSVISKIIKAGQGSWGDLLQSEDSQPVNLFFISDKKVIQVISDFAGLKPENMNIRELASNDFSEALKNDQYAIGFCCAGDISEINPDEGFISLLPFDKNENGKLDYYEDIYETPDKLHRGVWMGKYPKGLIRNYYISGSGIEENTVVNEFANWIMTNGQPLLADYGLDELASYERASGLSKINHPELIIEAEKSNYAVYKIIVTGFIIFLIAGLTISVFSLFGLKISRKKQPEHTLVSKVLDVNILDLPEGFFFDKTHTWIYMEKDGNVKMGVDDFIQHVTGKYSRVKLKEEGDTVRRNEPVLSLIRHGKQININAPVSGTIKEINGLLATDPDKINTSPYNTGWIYKIEPSNWLREISFFKMAKEYREWLKIEFSRLKAFLVVALNGVNTAEANITYQEGGELVDNVLQDLDPEIWEDFQRKFIDSTMM
ncbi:MAG: hypothetical protein JXR31_04625 [Prolixibacteraceae bacterium]|nr:hypothetical protein [Prolixibacteraceae bacterium]MBN2773509.1 hypothetical protein [Prolixibacteraceae bacterium]